MAIFEIPKGKKLKDKFFDLDLLKEYYNADSIAGNIRTDLNKALNKGLDYYIWVNPFISVINEQTQIEGGFNQKDETDAFYLSSEEI